MTNKRSPGGTAPLPPAPRSDTPPAMALRTSPSGLYLTEDETRHYATLRRYFTAAGIWLLAVAASGAALAVHTAGLHSFSSSSPLSPGRLLPFHIGAALYGLLGNLVFGLWHEMVPRLTARRPASENLSRSAFFIWNLGAVYGAVACLRPGHGIFWGIQTSVPGFEFPLFADLLLAAGAAIVAAELLLAFRRRREFRSYVSLWFASVAAIWLVLLILLGTLLFTPFLTAPYGEPAAGFCREGLILLWALPAGLSLAFYVVPLAGGGGAQGLLTNRTLALLGFWGYAFAAPLAAADTATWAATSWSRGLAEGARIWLLVPCVAILFNLFASLGSGKEQGGSPAARLARTLALLGILAFAAVLFAKLVDLNGEIAQKLELTSARGAAVHLLLAGGVLLWALAMLPLILRRVVGEERARALGPGARLFMLGLLLLVIGLGLEGLLQGYLREAGIGFNAVARATREWRLLATVGGLLGLIGAVLFSLSLWRALFARLSGVRPTGTFERAGNLSEEVPTQNLDRERKGERP